MTWDRLNFPRMFIARKANFPSCRRPGVKDRAAVRENQAIVRGENQAILSAA